MSDSYELFRLDPNTFEHLVNNLALKVLGPGLTILSSGADGGRDGYFQGTAPYPSESDCWSGTWYIQSKFHKLNGSKDPQKWLLGKIREEIKAFKSPESRRKWPDNWIIATNVDPSGVPQSGTFDKVRALIAKECPKLKDRFSIWGGQKILELLALYPEVGNHYGHFFTAGKVITKILEKIGDEDVDIKKILRFLVINQFDEQQYTKLEQAGSATDARPGIHKLFIDLPFRCHEHEISGMSMEFLTKTSAECHRYAEDLYSTKELRKWSNHPSRAGVWFIKGGPGHGKSTISQFMCQAQRAAFILNKDLPRIPAKQTPIAKEIKKALDTSDLFPLSPRIPISIELREFAQWFGEKKNAANVTPKGVLTYISELITAGLEHKVSVTTLRKLLGEQSWLVVFDGLDEVPQDVKDDVASEVCRFVNEVTLDINADILTICTSRPQGYAGQFDDLEGPTIELSRLSKRKALECAKPVLGLDRSTSESKKAYQILEHAIESPSVQELMTTPLQAHIMAVVVRDGQRPPERKWRLFTNFYQVIKRREANRNLPDKKISRLLQEQDKLLKTVHNRLGFVLHAQAESSKGAQSKLSRESFRDLVEGAVAQLVEPEYIDETVDTLMLATTDRLVLVNTPDDGNFVRFDIRPLQEFFAAEFLYESVSVEELRERMRLIASDAHWREVVHFLLSALVENERNTEISVVVQILEHLNESDDSDFRLLYQRLGRGAIPAARLLQEGVLEQDKGVRQQFRKCLEPLVASVHSAMLSPLNHVGQPNSFTWMVRFLISCFQEKKETENIGAAIVLLNVLPDGHKNIEEVSSFILSVSPEYFSILLTSQFTMEEIHGIGPESRPFWFYSLILRKILGSDWIFLEAEAFSNILGILQVKSTKIRNASEFSQISDKDRPFFELLFESRSSSRRQNRETRKVKNYGFIEVILNEPSWLIHDDFCLEPGVDEYKSPLVIQVLRAAITSVKRTNPEVLAERLSLVKDADPKLISLLLSKTGLDKLVDVDISTAENINKLKIIDEEEYKDILLNSPGSIRMIRSRAASDFDNSKIQFSALLDDYPEVCLLLWAQDIIPYSRDLRQVLSVSDIVEKIVEDPEVAFLIPGMWGDIIETCPEHANRFRESLLSVSDAKISERGSQKFSAFEVALPSEANLLPHLLKALIDSRERARRDIAGMLRYVQGKIKSICGSPLRLDEVKSNHKYSYNTRAAATLISLLHPDHPSTIKESKSSLVDFFQLDIGAWYVDALAFCLRLLTTEADPDARWIVNQILSLSRDQYTYRRYIQVLLDLWRESSYAPVQNSNVQETWLSGG